MTRKYKAGVTYFFSFETFSCQVEWLYHNCKNLHAHQGEEVGCLPYALWTVFVASSFADDDSRPLIMSLFTTPMVYRPKDNLPLTQSVVEAMWKKKDFDCAGIMTSGVIPGLEWQDTFTRLGWKMTLI